LKLFVCQVCGNVLYFENRACGRCGHRLAFLPEEMTLSVIEPDGEAWRALAEMGEPYRTLLGHFRHEVGHYFWDVLVHDGGKLEACRAVFGDDSVDYGESLQRHYAEGPPADWQQNFVSAVALYLRHQQREPRDGSARSLSLHPVAGRDRKARLYPRPGAGRGEGEVKPISRTSCW